MITGCLLINRLFILNSAQVDSGPHCPSSLSIYQDHNVLVGYVEEGTCIIYVLSSNDDSDSTIDQIQQNGFFIGRFGKGEAWRCSANPLGLGFAYTFVAVIYVDLPCEPHVYKFKPAVIPSQVCNVQLDKIAFPDRLLLHYPCLGTANYYVASSSTCVFPSTFADIDPINVTDHSMLTLSLSKWNFTHGSLCIYARCDACASDVLVIKQEDVMTSYPKSIDTLDIMKQISSFDLPPRQYQIKASVHHSPYFGKRSEHISFTSGVAKDNMDFSIVSTETISNVVFIKIRATVVHAEIFYWITPLRFKHQPTVSEISKYGTYAGDAEFELITLVVTDYYPSVLNTIFVAVLTGDGGKKIIKRRFLP